MRREAVVGSGSDYVLPGNAADSLLMLRITDPAHGDLMPLDSTPLGAEEREILRRWIDQGADWPAEHAEATHWAYQPPHRPSPPTAAGTPIDAFLEAELAARQMRPSPRAAAHQIARRAALVLTGLPPDPDDVRRLAAAADQSDWQSRYARFVDRLLASPAFGQRWATPWLDAARYADSNGYQADQLRDNWAYRDWVIEALNEDQPVDQFVIEQIAGDLLAEASPAQRIATGFHRMTTCNVEAGVDPEENRVNQVIDRVNTTATVLLGTTLECAQCHDHKYDPFTQRDYYRFFAFFNNTPLEVESKGGVRFDFTGPLMKLPLDAERRARQRRIEAEIAACRSRLEALGSEAADDAERKRCKQQLAALRKDLDELIQTTLVMVERDEPRQTFLLQRGDYRAPAEPVEPGVPAGLHPWNPDWPRNRLGLARWLVSRSNPLLPRVLVNRWWGQVFGVGIVSTSEDFGTQSEPPTHPQLLDWLAVEFVETGYSRKHMLRLMVTSRAFQRSAVAIDDNRQRDPENRLLSRGPQYRLPAEMIRDHALAVSGLLSRRAEGPPVMPYQPPGIWRAVGRNQPTWQSAAGEQRFRRGVYVVWKRAAPYPSFVNFDAPDRASCTVRRSRTNTPLQALTLLNDPAYVEMALALATRILNESPADDDAARLRTGVALVLGRHPSPRESNILAQLLSRERQRMRADPALARQRVQPPKVDHWPQLRATLKQPGWRIELAAWHAVASTLLNLDEAISL
jgi:hypothetical protein